ncbi:iron complex transport system substrate-binding protein [Roseomonas rosea]|uniref:Iron complex transport system substrate-binding protein n=1 Tax=Muricoccus roseus TaxID=198092 RepID=A0A1M6D4F3_9PROT|nr:ABC transporter substrate-binding protein [Roseomonas rosea]SHI67878.1 iron complex transport system substrate-binding protein [Roseomonas rosea]
MRRRSLLAAGPALLAARAARAVPSRVVCVGGALTECAFALGAGSRLVAVDTTSLVPPAAQRLPNIGYMRALPTEGLVALHPDLLLLSEEAGPPAAIEVLRAARMPIRTVPDGAGGEAAVAKLRAVAEALELPAEPMASALAEDWAALDAPIAALPTRPRGIFVLSGSSGAPLVSGRDTHADAAIRAAGAVNLVEGYRGYRPLSPEMAARMAPDFILMMDHALEAAGGPEAVLRMPALAVTPAAAARRVVPMPGSHLNFGPRAAEARRALALALRPGATLPALPERPWLRG